MIFSQRRKLIFSLSVLALIALFLAWIYFLPFIKNYFSQPASLEIPAFNDVRIKEDLEQKYYHDGDNGWQLINTDIVPSTDEGYDYMNVSNNFKVFFKKDPLTDTNNVKYQKDEGWMSFDSISAIEIRDADNKIKIGNKNQLNQDSEGKISGTQKNKLIYEKLYQDVAQGIYLNAEYQVSPTELLEEIVLNKYQDITSISQNITTSSNVYVKEEIGGDIGFYNKTTDERFFTVPRPKMYEYNDRAKDNYGLHYELTKIDKTHYVLKKTIDGEGAQWLLSKNTTYPVVIDSTVSYGSEYVFNSGETYTPSVAALDSTHFVAVYEDYANSHYGTARVGTISGSTISYGSEYVFNLGSSYDTFVAALDSTHFVVSYVDISNSSYGTAIIGTVSGSTISYGSEYVFNPGVTFVRPFVAALDSTHFVVGYTDQSNSYYGTAIIGTVSSGNQISYGSEYVFRSDTTTYISVAALDSTHFVVGYSRAGSDSNGLSIIGTVSSGNQISYGSEYVFSSPATTYYISVAALDSTHFVAGYQGDTAGTAIIGTVSSGNQISYGSEYIFNPNSITGNISVAALDSTHFVLTYADYVNSSYGTARVGTISGTTISYGSEYVFNSGSTANTSVAMLDATNFVTAYKDSANSSYGTARVGTIVSTDATLSNFTISQGTLTPAFDSATTSYTASVANNITSMTVTPTANESHATIKVNNVTVVSGSPSGSISLDVGSNDITTIVTAQDGVTTKQYTLTVTRLSADATLSNLTISQGTLTPAFDSATISYTASVANNITSMTVTPTANESHATIKVNNVTVVSGHQTELIALNVGENVITTIVTAQDGTTTKTYTLTVTRAASSDATLSNFTISHGTLTPSFASATISYTASVANNITSMTVTPTANSSVYTSITVNGSPVTSGSPSGSISLDVGSNVITTIVTAQDGTTTKTYTLTVTRAASSDATLSNLVISEGTLTPTFLSSTVSYTASVANNITSMTVTPTANSSVYTSITVNGSPVTSGSPSDAISLDVGSNVITTIVTAQNGTTTKTYTLTVTRISTDATLSNFTISEGTLTPSFASGTISYTASVANNITSMTVTPTANESHATIKVNGATVVSGSASGSISLSVGSNTITTVVTALDGTTKKTYTVVVTRASSEDWLTGWTYRKKITINNANVGSDLTNFPVHVKINADSNMSTALATGYDVRFTSSDKKTLLDFERETWSGGGGGSATAEFWVEVPTVATAADTDIYIYWGKSDAADASSATAVWDSNFKAVWHLKEATGVNNVDSTSNGNTGTPVNVTANAAGQIGGAENFGGTSSITMSDTVSLDLPTAWTYSAWVKRGANVGSAVDPLFSHWVNSTTSRQIVIYFAATDNKLYVNVPYISDTLHGTAAISDTNWHLVTATRSGNLWTTYIDGAYDNSTTAAVTQEASANGLVMGESTQLDWHFRGSLDEARVSSIARDADWIKFEYCNMLSAATSPCTGGYELTFAAEETLDGGGGSGNAILRILKNLKVKGGLKVK